MEDHISDLIRQIMRLAGMLQRQVHGGIDASASELLALEELGNAPMTQNVLAARLGLEKSTVSRLLAGMEAKGWVSRHRDPRNRRLLEVRLSSSGQGAVRRAAAHLHHTHAHLAERLSDAERAALAVGVAALARVLSEDGADERRLGRAD